MNPMLIEAIGTIIRWLFAFLSGYLVSHGVWTKDKAEEYATALASAAAVGIASLLWGLWQKYKGRIKLNTALASTAPQSESQLNAKIDAGLSAPASTPKNETPEITLK